MLNQVTLIGYLGKDPELRYTGSGTAVCKFSLATTEKWTDSSGKTQEKTEWHNIIVWKKQGENCHKFLAKGRPVTILGKIAYRSYDDKGGNKRYITEIIAQRVIFLPSKDGASGSGGGGGGSRHDAGGDPEWPDDTGAPGDDDIPF